MARVVVSSSNLMRHVRAFEALGADCFEMQVAVEQTGCLVCLSSTGRTELPCESRWFGKGARVSVAKLLAALKMIEDQPITLDLHDGMDCKLFACHVNHLENGRSEYTNVVFEI